MIAGSFSLSKWLRVEGSLGWEKSGKREVAKIFSKFLSYLQRVLISKVLASFHLGFIWDSLSILLFHNVVLPICNLVYVVILPKIETSTSNLASWTLIARNLKAEERLSDLKRSCSFMEPGALPVRRGRM